MSAQKKTDIPADKLELYEKLVATNPKVERKGAANPYTSLNGHMFTYLDPAGFVALRLDKDEITEFMKKYKTPQPVSYGVVKKEYVTVPDSLLKNTKELQKYFEWSYRYVESLKPNPSKKKS